MDYILYEGDCLDIMPTLEAGSVDCILADIPYGTTACRWDTVIPFAPMWENIKRLIKPRGAVVLFGSQTFTSALVMSNPKWFKYQWVWEKSLVGDVMNAKNKPMKKHEDIAVFSNGTTANCSDRLMTYNPQGIIRLNQVKNNYYRLDGQATFKPRRPSHGKSWIQEFTNYPTTILKFPNGNQNSPHPTAKPVDLMAYLIRTYTNPGETVLDFTMGSGSTGVAAIQEGRRFVGIEKDTSYFEIAQRRISEATRQPALLEVA
jgi:site-specific DNA-methyltransferase (adenine-specific)